MAPLHHQPSRAEPSRAEPSRAEPSRAERSRASKTAHTPAICESETHRWHSVMRAQQQHHSVSHAQHHSRVPAARRAKKKVVDILLDDTSPSLLPPPRLSHVTCASTHQHIEHMHARACCGHAMKTERRASTRCAQKDEWKHTCVAHKLACTAPTARKCKCKCVLAAGSRPSNAAIRIRTARKSKNRSIFPLVIFRAFLA